MVMVADDDDVEVLFDDGVGAVDEFVAESIVAVLDDNDVDDCAGEDARLTFVLNAKLFFGASFLFRSVKRALLASSVCRRQHFKTEISCIKRHRTANVLADTFQHRNLRAATYDSPATLPSLR